MLGNLAKQTKEFFLTGFIPSERKGFEIYRLWWNRISGTRCTSSNDLVPLLIRQICEPNWEAPKILNLGGGLENSLSLKELSIWCEKRFGPNEISSSQEERPMDAPWIVMDSSVAKNAWNWRPKIGINQILEEIASFADDNPDWLSRTPELMKINFCDLTLPENSERIIWEKARGLVQSNGFILGTEVTEFEDAFIIIVKLNTAKELQPAAMPFSGSWRV